MPRLRLVSLTAPQSLCEVPNRRRTPPSLRYRTVVRGRGSRALSFEVDDRRRMLLVSGEIDLANVDRLVEAAVGVPGDGPLRLDLRGVTFIDSTGIRGLVEIARVKGEVVLVAPRRSVRRVLDLVGLHASLPLRVEDEPRPEDP